MLLQGNPNNRKNSQKPANSRKPSASGYMTEKMTNKHSYIESLRSGHSDAPEEFFELCWLLHDEKKARSYADILSACTSYADIAQKVVRPMYVSGEIDILRARSEKFLGLLISLACLDKPGNAHSAAYHVRQMLNNDPDISRERRQLEGMRQKAWRDKQVAEAAQPSAPSCKIIMEINDPECMHMLIEFLRSSGAKYSVLREGHSVVHYYSIIGVWRQLPLARRVLIEETPQGLYATMTGLRRYFPEAIDWPCTFCTGQTTCETLTFAKIIDLLGQELP